MSSISIEAKEKKLLTFALVLSAITIFYNILEGLFSTFFGMREETLALFGFGVDSYVEVISGLGVGHMIYRMKNSAIVRRDQFESRALRITGFSFYLLTGGLLVGSALSLWFGYRPHTTIPGVVIASLSILSMWFLKHYKLKVGRALNSEPIIADARCTETCFYLSFILLASSAFYEFWRVSYVDVAGSLGIAFFAWREGREAFQKAKSGSLSCACEDGCHLD